MYTPKRRQDLSADRDHLRSHRLTNDKEKAELLEAEKDVFESQILELNDKITELKSEAMSKSEAFTSVLQSYEELKAQNHQLEESHKAFEEELQVLRRSLDKQADLHRDLVNTWKIKLESSQKLTAEVENARTKLVEKLDDLKATSYETKMNWESRLKLAEDKAIQRGKRLLTSLPELPLWKELLKESTSPADMAEIGMEFINFGVQGCNERALD
ncbi:hypothetical protein BCR39DRAFT_562598 [Naematelia encephala]|uniref:Uncharacterized protein n=1 Tax=Naematelia encephala TaxID=71784 RepID=A0A1Y2AGD3_9TREE|nr:hypothetical protein BCR39DRAFT_562598 [Naematelia encephala]